MILSNEQKQLLAIALGIYIVKKQRSQLYDKSKDENEDRFCKSPRFGANLTEILHKLSISNSTSNKTITQSRLVTLFELSVSSGDKMDSSSHSKIGLLNGLRDCTNEQMVCFEKHVTKKLMQTMMSDTIADHSFLIFLNQMSSLLKCNTDLAECTTQHALQKTLFSAIMSATLDLSSRDKEFNLYTDYFLYERLGSLCVMVRHSVRQTLHHYKQRVVVNNGVTEETTSTNKNKKHADNGTAENSYTSSVSYAQKVKQFEEFARMKTAAVELEQWILQRIADMIDKVHRRFPLVAAILMQIVSDVENE